MIRFLFSLLLLLRVGTAGFSQKPAELKKSGERFIAAKRWSEARDALAQYQQQKPGDPAVLTQLGIALYQLHQADKARQYFEYVAAQTKDPEAIYYLARTLHGQGEYEQAIAQYKAFLRAAKPDHPMRGNAVDNIKRCIHAPSVALNEAVALVENLGDRVNSAGDEFAPLPSPNRPERLYYSAGREGVSGGRRNAEGYEDENNGAWPSDMQFTQLRTSGWEAGSDLGGLLNTPRYEMPLDFGMNGQVLYYFRGFSLYSGDIIADTAGRHDEYAVNPPTFASPMRPEEGDGAPFFFNDNTLLFASRRSGGQGGLDLWLTMRTDSGWTEPQNLGAEINSPYDETTPCLARDGRTLYFSSNRLSSLGGLDVFRAVFDDAKQSWEPPVNMGTPLNSPADDAFFRLAADGRSAYFSSDRFESMGERDLFIAYFKEAQEEQLHASTPPSFAGIGAGSVTAAAPGAPAEKIALPPLLYTDDRDVLSPDNVKVLNDAAGLTRVAPSAKLVVTAHTDDNGPIKFDLYAGIKRAEIVGKALLERGVPPERIMLRSAGSRYPLARNVLDAEPNPVGRRLNRRIEISFASTAGAPLPNAELQLPEVSPLMATPAAAEFLKKNEGLTYRVEFATTRQVLTSDALGMFDDLMIESQPGSGQYRYTAGFFKQFAEAGKLRKELAAQGFPEAVVTAYVDGLRVTKAEAVALVRKFPDLLNYVKG